ncbi:TetR/AcrR family transcriptional regulator [Kitasatospora xanthocidica]|uniref:TetR/AcrR family transcriptional regulator n=3 Tax=Kitasatospora TaxID=2063 RepID=A0A372ZQ35_9ACTN|nr:ScbR family autoregulator-binding transcription factor [Kitasatospora xanthocidica]RGD57347.1 TetR/AcrR family transcriptional regulator [Kitasatospora xanthocidica]
MVQERSERTRGRLVEAGAALFDRRGYAGATLGEIAAAAGVTKGALYFHFASKEELARAVSAQAERSLRSACAELRAASSPLQGLIDAGYWLVEALGTDPVIRAAFRLGREDGGWQVAPTTAAPATVAPVPATARPAAADPGQQAFADIRGFHSVWAGVVRDLLAGARRAGELRDRSGGLGPETLVVAAACGLEVVFADGCPAGERARRVGALWDWLLPCLVPPGRGGGYRTRPPAPQPA